jgi:hypothetical protein
MNDETLTIRLPTQERGYLREFLRRRRLTNPALTESDVVREVLHNALVAHGVIPDDSLEIENLPTDDSPPVPRRPLPREEVDKILLDELGLDCRSPSAASVDEKQAPNG